MAHIWISQVHKEVSPNSQQPWALPRRDTLIPRAFLFISCFSPRQKYWVLVSLSDFKAGRKGQLCKNRGHLRRDGGGEAETLLGDQLGPDQGASTTGVTW